MCSGTVVCWPRWKLRCVARDAAATVKDLHGGCCDAHLDVLLHELVRGAVEVPIHLDVVVECELPVLPRGVLIPMLRQWPQRGPLDLFEQAAT